MVVTAAASVIVHPFGTGQKPRKPAADFEDANIDRLDGTIVRASVPELSFRANRLAMGSYVAPVSWLLERDVSSARAQLNLSRWDEYSVFQRETLLAAIGAAVRNRQMPPTRFTLVHPEAALSPGEQGTDLSLGACRAAKTPTSGAEVVCYRTEQVQWPPPSQTVLARCILMGAHPGLLVSPSSMWRDSSRNERI